MDEKQRELVLAIFPTRTGFGWALFESALSPVAWGTATVTDNKHLRSLARVEKLIRRYQPDVLILEQFDGKPSRRSVRIRKLCRAIMSLADTRGVTVRIVTREEIGGAFGSIGASGRYEIAKTIASHVDALFPWLPPERKIWMPEHPRMGLFNAAALAVTYFAQD